MLWRNLYLLKIPGIKSKVRIGIDWFIHLLFPPDLAQTRLIEESGIKNQHFEPGDIVFHEGDLGDSVYVIEKGECEVIKKEDGEVRVVATLQAGNYFGEMALLSERSRNATVRARTALEVLLIPKGDFNRLRTSIPAFGEVFRELAKKRAEEG